MKFWREMLYCLGILLLSKDIKDLGILWNLFQSMLTVVFDEFDYWVEGLSSITAFKKLLGRTTKVEEVHLYFWAGVHRYFNLYWLEDAVNNEVLLSMEVIKRLSWKSVRDFSMKVKGGYI